MDNLKNELLEVISGLPKNLESICTQILDFIGGQEKESQPEWLKAFLTEIMLSDIDIDNAEEFLEMEVPNEKAEYVIEMEQRVVSNMVKQRVTVEAFYQALWDKLTDDTLLAEKESKSIFLQYLWLDTRIPYYQLGKGIVLGNEKYREIRGRIQPQIRKGRFILDANLQYKTERSSLLMELAATLGDETERVVFWADLLARQQSKIRALQRALARQGEEMEEPEQEAE